MATRIIDGKKFTQIGSSPTSKPKIKKWAEFQRRTNNKKVRVVKVGKKYTAFVR